MASVLVQQAEIKDEIVAADIQICKIVSQNFKISAANARVFKRLGKGQNSANIGRANLDLISKAHLCA